MSDWFSVSLQTESADKRTAVFAIKNVTLQPLRVRAVATGVEMVGAAPFIETFFHIEPTLFTLEPGEVQAVAVSLSPTAPAGRKLAVRLRVEKADVTDHFEHGPGVELGIEAIPRKKIPPWVWFAIGGSVITAIVAVIIVFATRECSSNDDCSSSYACYQHKCVCGYRGKCPNNIPVCHANQCKPDCTVSGGACSSGQYCNTQIKVCVDGCDDDGDCAKGFYCNTAVNECRCGDVSFCSADEVCYEDECRDACSATKECGKGRHCELTAGACMPGCATNANCDTGFSCKNTVCSCGGKRACASNQVCFNDRCLTTCGPGKPSCKVDLYCFNDSVCVAPCDSNADCPHRYKCDATTHTCKCTLLSCKAIPGESHWGRGELERPVGMPIQPGIPLPGPHPMPSGVLQPSPRPNP